MLEHVEEGLIRQRVEIDEIQCGIMLGCGTTDAIFIWRQLQKKHLIVNKPIHVHGLRLPWEESIWWCSSRFHLVGDAHAWNRRVVSAPGPVHVQGCKKPGKSRWWILPVIRCLSWFSSFSFHFIIVLEALSRQFRTFVHGSCSMQMT